MLEALLRATHQVVAVLVERRAGQLGPTARQAQTTMAAPVAGAVGARTAARVALVVRAALLVVVAVVEEEEML